MFKPRPLQAEVLKYCGGRMAVLAVPGSGKTQTLASLAANLIIDGMLDDEQEVLVVTLVNSAVNNFSSRVTGLVSQSGLLPNLGYRVRTLHGLAHDIVRDRPSLVGLESNFQIVDERTSDEILSGIVDAWIRAHPDFEDQYLDLNLEETRINRIRRKEWPELVKSLAQNMIKLAKDLQATPGTIQDRLSEIKAPLPLLELGLETYSAYQRALAYRGAVDFDDLIRLALQAMILDEDFLHRLQHRWPFILEDEAQDSSLLQEDILRRLAGENGNWVRVGDPNQSIFETFTTASPKHLRAFRKEPGVINRELRESGRSGEPILYLANHLIEWSNESHPVEGVRNSLEPPFIYPTAPDDPQPNPKPGECSVVLVPDKFTPDEEMKYIVKSLLDWLPKHGQSTVAVLAPSNSRGDQFVDTLKGKNIPCIELLRSTKSTRDTAAILGNILRCLAEPTSTQRMVTAYKVFRREYREQPDKKNLLGSVMAVLTKCAHVEAYVHPSALNDWLVDRGDKIQDTEVMEELLTFRPYLQRWHAAILLPVDQVIQTVAQDLFTDPIDLAMADKLAVVIRRSADDHPDWGFDKLSDEIALVANNGRKFLGFSDEETGFDPELYRGKVVVATMHKAKGLEWDRVYLTSVNNYDFPSAQVHDQFISEKYYLRDRLNLEAEALNQLTGLLERDPAKLFAPEKDATIAAREEYAAERLRLLYVGITRAKKDLIVTWNNGRFGTQEPAAPLIALQEIWRERTDYA